MTTLLTVLVLGSLHLPAAPLGTAFSYQGKLTDGGQPANGTYDLRFAIYNVPSGGSSVAGPITNSPVSVTNGLFTTALDFGGGVFTGDARWLEIAVRTNGSAADSTTLAPRQSLTATPYALFTPNAGEAASAGRAAAVTANGVANTSLQANAVTSDKIADGTITAADVNAGSFSNTFWKVDGNAGTTAGPHFLGTTDTQPLEFKISGQRALRLEWTTNFWGDVAVNVIGGSPYNSVGSNTTGAVIAGGGYAYTPGYTFVANRVEADYSSILGGIENTIKPGHWGDVIAGGWSNTIANAAACSIGGGSLNQIGYLAHQAVIGGGVANRIEGTAYYSTISGGLYNSILTNASRSVIAGGASNQVAPYAYYASIAGGLGNRVGTNADYSAIGGGWSNNIAANSWDATIAGGYSNGIGMNSPSSSIGGGYENKIADGSVSATIAGGNYNDIGADSTDSAIGGGYENKIADDSLSATIAGGQGNNIGSNTDFSTIGGGFHNNIASNALNATIPGGDSNFATNYAFAAGRRAKANHTGAFVWADSTYADFASTGNNQFSVRAGGGVRLITGGAGLTIDGESALSGLVEAGQLAAGAVVSSNLAVGAVTSTAIADGTITPADINTGSFSNTFWKTDGNVGTVPGTHFVGTTDNRPLELRANAERAFRLEPGAYWAPNVVGGSASNAVDAGVIGATIAGGGTYGSTFTQFPSPGPIAPFPPTFHPNRVSGNFGTVGGGAHNSIGPATVASTVGGGYDNAVAERSSAATVSGGANNWILTNATGAAIGGGRDNILFNDASYSRIGGGRQNWALPGAQYATIAGGATNTIQENVTLSSIGGGWLNTVQAGVQFSTIGGGGLNTIGTNTISGTIAGGAQNQLGVGNLGSAIGGGGDNLIATNTRYGTIPGGLNNTVAGDYGFAAGRRARAVHAGSFVWADSANADFSSTAANQFLIRASGGVGIGGPPQDSMLDVEGDVRLNDHDLLLRGGSDRNHGLGWHGSGKPFAGVTVDGPVTYGWNGGALGTLGPEKIVLFWNWLGQVGIGTSAPGTALDVAGTVRATAFEGDGSGLTNCNAGQLDGLDSSAFWKVGGNAGTSPGTHFLGTTDNKAVEFKVNGQRALRIEPNISGRPNVIGGSTNNVVGADVVGATISGGSYNTIPSNTWYATIAGGGYNTIGSDSGESAIGGGIGNQIGSGSAYGTIAGGDGNAIGANSTDGAIGGGTENTIAANTLAATIAGGGYNEIGTNAAYCTIAGGSVNHVGTAAMYAAIPGGYFNFATSYAFAAGNRAKANHTGAFVWADSTDADFASTGSNQFLIRASGGVGIGTGNPAAMLDVAGTVRLGTGGTTISRIQAGTIVVGTGTAGVNVRTNTFPVAFSSTPKVLVSARGGEYNDTFAVSTRGVSATGFKVNVIRLDLSGGWSQNLQVDWIAWE